MIKSELIQKVAAANPHLFHRDVERIVNVIFDEIVADIAEKPEQTAELLRSWLAEDKSREAYAQAA